ncbi:MAG TPA: hypothetical protein VNA20_05720 [Frankiaceae bacterium]|nr:hypothetical protein [Frankiaceae bacterium]
MRTARKLVVKRESLGELSTDELGSVAGGSVVSALLAECPSDVVGGCPTHFGRLCDPISRLVRPCVTDNC